MAMLHTDETFANLQKVQRRFLFLAANLIGTAEKWLHGGYMAATCKKHRSEIMPNCLILMVPPVGIEPTPDDYKSTARPSCYGGNRK
jgi:hypothetical protein